MKTVSLTETEVQLKIESLTSETPTKFKVYMIVQAGKVFNKSGKYGEIDLTSFADFILYQYCLFVFSSN